jgi:hypothetical protein
LQKNLSAGIGFFRFFGVSPPHPVAIAMIRYVVRRTGVQGILAHPCAVEPVIGTEIPGKAGTTFIHSKPSAGVILMLAMSEKIAAVIPGKK